VKCNTRLSREILFSFPFDDDNELKIADRREIWYGNKHKDN
jgi:hypothetical protein